MSNWYLNNYAFPNKDQIQYVITAFAADSSKNAVTEFEELRMEMRELKNLFEEEFIHSMTKQNKIEQIIISQSKQIEILNKKSQF